MVLLKRVKSSLRKMVPPSLKTSSMITWVQMKFVLMHWNSVILRPIPPWAPLAIKPFEIKAKQSVLRTCVNYWTLLTAIISFINSHDGLARRGCRILSKYLVSSLSTRKWWVTLFTPSSLCQTSTDQCAWGTKVLGWLEWVGRWTLSTWESVKSQVVQVMSHNVLKPIKSYMPIVGCQTVSNMHLHSLIHEEHDSQEITCWLWAYRIGWFPPYQVLFCYEHYETGKRCRKMRSQNNILVLENWYNLIWFYAASKRRGARSIGFGEYLKSALPLWTRWACLQLVGVRHWTREGPCCECRFLDKTLLFTSVPLCLWQNCLQLE